MTEELNKKAEEYVNKIFIYSNGALVHSALIEFAEEAIKDETRELKRELEEERFVTEDLKKQIEQMKCCPNCDFIFWNGNCYYDKECKNKDHWKLKEIKEK